MKDSRTLRVTRGGGAILLAYLLTIVMNSCDCGTEPPPPDNGLDTTSHAFTWQRDTLGDGSFQSLPGAIWGSAPNDVYVVGHASALFTGKIWHWDGSSWTDITTKYAEAFSGGPIYYFAPIAVFGFGWNDVWIVGIRDTSYTPQPIKQGFVMHYDGTQWDGVSPPSALGLFAVWGRSPNDLWVGGIRGRFHHFDGSGWSGFTVADTILIEWFAGVLSGKPISGGFTHNNATGRDYDSMLEWDGTSWQMTESSMRIGQGTPFTVPIEVIAGQLYSAPYYSVTRRVSQGSWQTLFTDPLRQFHNIDGDAANNIFVVGGPGSEVIYHFNGASWHRFSEFNDPNIEDTHVWVNGGHVFVLGLEISPQGTFWSKSFVARGITN